MTNNRLLLPVAVLAAVLAGVVALIALSSGGGSSTPAAAGNGVDRAFAQQMVPHHRDAVAMAEMAQQSTQRPELLQVAADIVSAQTAEIATLQAIDGRLGAAGIEPGKLASPSMDGMAMEGMGGGDPMAMLEGAKPFDRAFIDAMVAHHQGAIVMARDVLDRGSDPEVRGIAEAVVDAQSREIEQLNRWRTDWYGAPSPAGGVPAA